MLDICDNHYTSESWLAIKSLKPFMYHVRI